MFLRESLMVVLMTVLAFGPLGLKGEKAKDEMGKSMEEWLNDFFRELSRGISPDVLVESIPKNKDRFVLINEPNKIGATLPVGVIQEVSSPHHFCQGENSTEKMRNVAYATQATHTQSFSVACMRISDYKAFPLQRQNLEVVEPINKAISLLMKFYPQMNVSRPFTDQEVRHFIQEKEGGENEALRTRMNEIQDGDNMLSRNIPSLNDLYQRARDSFEKKNKDASLEEREQDGFDSPFFNSDFDDETPDSRASNVNADEPSSPKSPSTTFSVITETLFSLSTFDSETTSPQTLVDTVSAEGDTRYKTKYKTVLGILLTVLAVVAIIILVYIYRRQQRTRIFQISGHSTPTSRETPPKHNIFEPQILLYSPRKNDPEASLGEPVNVKEDQMLSVPNPSSRRTSVSSARSNPFLGTEVEVPKLPPPPHTPASVHSLASVVHPE